MATTGYIVHATPVGSEFEHTNNNMCFYGPDDTWWALFEHTSDQWFLYKYTGTLPASPGDTGGWSRAQENGAGDLAHVGDNASFRPSLYYDPSDSELHIYQQHTSSSELYYRLQYNAGTDDWTREVDAQNTGITGDKNAFVVDSTGIPWIIWFSSTQQIRTRYRDGGTGVWTNGADIQATGDGSTGNQRCGPGFRCTIGGVACVGTVVSNDTTTDEVAFWYRADSAGKTDAWTKEVVDNTAYTADDHVGVAVGKFSGDTDSTIIVIAKELSSGYPSYRREPTGGTWSSQNNDITSNTRIKLVMDETNEEVYAFFTDGGNTRAAYRKSTASGALSWDTAVTALEDDGVATFSTDIGVAESKPLTNNSLMIFGASGGKTWWNVLTLAGAGAGGGGGGSDEGYLPSINSRDSNAVLRRKRNARYRALRNQ